MKYLKMLGLAAIAAASLAFVGASCASATVLCKVEPTGGKCPAGQAYAAGTETHSVTEEPSVLTGTQNIECPESTVTSQNENEGNGTETVKGPVSTLAFGPPEKCTCPITVVKRGTLEIHSIAGSSNGTLTSSGTEVTITCNTIFGAVHCIYVTNNTNLGTLTGSSTTKGTATMDITAEIPQLKTSGLCSSTAVWHAKYKVTTPDTVYVAEST